MAAVKTNYIFTYLLIYLFIHLKSPKILRFSPQPHHFPQMTCCECWPPTRPIRGCWRSTWSRGKWWAISWPIGRRWMATTTCVKAASPLSPTRSTTECHKGETAFVCWRVHVVVLHWSGTKADERCEQDSYLYAIAGVNEILESVTVALELGKPQYHEESKEWF